MKMYRPNFYESSCLRCNEIVYQVDRIGPLKDFTFFHSGCFKCVHCGTKLTLKTYYNNQHKHEDKEVSGQTQFLLIIIFILFVTYVFRKKTIHCHKGAVLDFYFFGSRRQILTPKMIF